MASVVSKKHAGNRQKTLKPGFKKSKASSDRTTNATLVVSVVENRNGETAPIMSRAQNFNNPPPYFIDLKRFQASHMQFVTLVHFCGQAHIVSYQYQAGV